MTRRTRRADDYIRTQVYYIDTDGSSARQLQPEYEPESERSLPREPQVKPAGERLPRKHPLDGIGFFVFSVLLLATIVTMGVCFDYLKVQSGITNMQKKISVMEGEIIEQQKENRELQEKLESSVDLSYIYDVATKELGMVQPKKSQVKSYTSKKSDMVRQYGEVPELSE